MAGCTSDERCKRVLRWQKWDFASRDSPMPTAHGQSTTLNCSETRTHKQLSYQPFQQVPAATRADRRRWDGHWNTVGILQEALARHKWRGPWQEEDTAQGMDICRRHPQAGNKEREENCAEQQAQEDYTAVDREVKRSIRKDKRDYIDDLARQADSSQTGESEGPVPGDQEVNGQIPADRQASEGQEGEPTDNNQGTAETMGGTLQGTAELPNPWLTTRHPICRDRTAHRLWQTLKGRDQEGHHDSEEGDGCRARWDTSRSHQSRHRDSCQHAIQPLQQDLGEGGDTGPVERRSHHPAAKRRRP